MRQYFLGYNAEYFVYIAMNMELGELRGVFGWTDTRAMIRGIITYEERFCLINKVSAGFVKELNVTELLKKFSLCLTQSYMGHTGYSAKENVNNIDIVHLHWGLQLIFDESQKEGDNEIWIDIYPLTRFLAKHT